jgi:hypothetical protein
MESGQTSVGDQYPVQFSVDYPDRDLDRLSTALRILWAIPIVVVFGAIGGGWGSWGAGNGEWMAAGGGGVLFFPVLLMVVFRQKYPRWWYDWNLELMRFESRVGVYLGLLDDRYPSTDERQSVTLDFAYPDAKNGLNRWLPLVKWFLAIPHYIVLAFLFVATLVCVIIAWFAILFTGRYPRGLVEFVVGVGRWANRVNAYAFALVTDRYPPFRLSP